MAAQNFELDVQELLNLFQDNGVTRNPRHLETIGLRMLGGWWGEQERYQSARIILQDDDGEPLQVPRWEEVLRPVNPLAHFVISAPWDQLRRAFHDLDVGNGALRFGPLANGNYIPEDPYSTSYRPVNPQEMAQMQRDELEEVLEVQGEIELQMIDLIEMQTIEIRGLRQLVNELQRERDSGRGASIPGASSSPPPQSYVGLPGMPSVSGLSSLQPEASSTPGGRAPRVSFHPSNPFVRPPSPERPRARSSERIPLPLQPPVIQYVPVPQPVLAPAPAPSPVIPIQHIRAVTGEVPNNPRDIPMWIGRNAPAIEGVYPVTTPDLRARIINALIGGKSGIHLTAPEAVTWASAVAAIFTRTHGSFPMHNLSAILTGIANGEGVESAYNLGMMLSNGDFNLVYGIVRGLLPGQAAVAYMQQRLDAEPSDALRAQNFIQHLHLVYEILGLNHRGQSIRTSLPTSTRPRGQGRGRGQGQGSIPSTPRRPQSGRGLSTPNRGSNNANNNTQSNVQTETPRRSFGGYNLRPNTFRPQRYGGGQGQRRDSQPDRRSQGSSQNNRPSAPLESRGEQSRGPGGGGRAGGRRNQNRNSGQGNESSSHAVNAVTQSAVTEQQNESPTPPPTSGGRS
ncbi:gag protein [Simian foamy virus Pongo pygmaeus pygmaeus]|uniref:Gag polyprotein n=1 Tax=Simian foamy virus Pongo pygmaeus pygmaeus TaxID=221703 RepID=Q7SIS7_9RETR|nr:gag protein [Simian foamy virus Pongo pygmaeus pygmaeus]CAD67561.1 gag protein [Simian foamy virus Pongo pygmaeus pygmaeus]